MAVSIAPTEERLTLHSVPWNAYYGILAALGDRRLRHTYDRGEFEMMSPSREHERLKKLIGRLIDTVSLELNVAIQSVGSSTLRREHIERGLEPDDAYYVAHEPQIRGRDDYDPEQDPPPDLVVEIDVTSSSVPRMPVYAALGIPEIWRYRRGVVSFHARQGDGSYAEIDRSVAFPLLRSEDIRRFLDQRNATDETAWLRSFVAWVRNQSKAEPN